MTDDSAMNDRLAALEALLAQQSERMARQEAEIAQLRAARAAPHVEALAGPTAEPTAAEPTAAEPTAEPTAAEPTAEPTAEATEVAEAPHALASRRSLLKLGGAAAVAGVTAGAAALVNHAYAAPATLTNWTTSSFTADVETIVKPASASYTAPDLLQLQAGTGTVYSPLTAQLLNTQAALAAYDTTTTGVGVYGTSSTGFGLFGVTGTGTGATGAGLNGTANSTGTGVSGNSQSGIGVQGNGGLYGGVFNGGSAPLVLGTTSAVGAPTSGTHVKGEISLDSNAVMWVCVAGGTPGTWAKPGVNLLPSPIRIFDSRPGQPAPLPISKGFLAGGSTTTIQVTGTDVGGIHVPAGATGVIGNLTVTGTGGAGDLILYPTGTTQPLTSNINYVGGQTIANSATVGLNTSGQMNLFVHVSGTYALFDVAGFFF